MAREDVRIVLPIVPQLDKRAVQTMWTDIRRLKKELKEVDMDFQKASKSAGTAASQLKQAASAMRSGSKAATGGGGGGNAIRAAKAARAAVAGPGASPRAVAAQTAVIQSTIRQAAQVKLQTKLMQAQTAAITQSTKAQKAHIASLQQAAKFGMAKGVGHAGLNMIKAMSSGNLSGVLRGAHAAGGSLRRGVHGHIAKHRLSKAAAGHASPGGVASGSGFAEALGGAGAAIGGMVTAVALVAKLIEAASGAMKKLNKELVSGVPLAGDFGKSAAEYGQAIDDIRDAAVNSQGDLIKFGVNAEMAMKVSGAFAKTATGSIIRTRNMLKGMGGGDVESGLKDFAKHAQLYGKALGLEATDVASMMGDMVSEIGIDSNNVLGIMGDVVKQAQQSGMPVTKFLDVFKMAIPNLDMFSNRIEEVTGMIKLMSKTLDPRAVKNFMSAFGKGFDQLDFKQRLKMALVVGQGATKNIMERDMKRASKSMAKDLPVNLRGAFEKAAATGKGFKGLAARAAAEGVGGAGIGNIQHMARYSRLAKSGSVLNNASAMRDMGMSGRMEMLTKYAKSMGTGLDGLGEHVAKQLGVSESEYKAMLDLDNSMGVHMDGLAEVGRTSSKSINEGLKVNEDVLAFAKKNKMDVSTDDGFESVMKLMAKTDNKTLERAVKDAATDTAEGDEKRAAEERKLVTNQDDIMKKQLEATLTVGDILENVFQVILTKIYSAIDKVVSSLGSLYDMMPEWIMGSKDGTAKEIMKMSTDAGRTGSGISASGAQYVRDTNKQILDVLGKGADGKDELVKMAMSPGGLMGGTRGKSTGEVRDMVSGSLSKADTEEFVNAFAGLPTENAYDENGQAVQTNDSLQKLAERLEPEKLAKLMAAFTVGRAGSMQDTAADLGGRKGVKSNVETKAENEARIAANLGADTDTRYTQAYSNIDPGVASGIAAMQSSAAPGAAGSPGGSPAGVAAARAVDSAGEHKDAAVESAKTQETIAATSEQQYDTISDTLTLLKKGIKFEDTFLRSKYKKTVAEAVTDATRVTLMEFLIAQNMLNGSENTRNAVYKNPEAAMMLGLQGLPFLNTGENEAETTANLLAGNVSGHYSAGIDSVARTGMAVVHEGEAIVSKTKNQERGGGKGQITVNVYAHTNASPAQIAAHVERTMTVVANRQ